MSFPAPTGQEHTCKENGFDFVDDSPQGRQNLPVCRQKDFKNKCTANNWNLPRIMLLDPEFGAWYQDVHKNNRRWLGEILGVEVKACFRIDSRSAAKLLPYFIDWLEARNNTDIYRTVDGASYKEELLASIQRLAALFNDPFENDPKIKKALRARILEAETKFGDNDWVQKELRFLRDRYEMPE